MSVLIPIAKLRPDPANPRRAGVGDITEMAASIAEMGVLQALLVTPDPEAAAGEGYLVVFGHRRLAGAIAAGLVEVPAEIRVMGPAERLAVQLVENLQRAEIDALDEARAYQRLLELGLSQHEVADRVGRSQGHVSKRLGLLKLPAAVRKALDSGGITISDAFQLTRLKESGRILTAFKNGPSWGFERAVENELRAAKQAKARKEAIAGLKAAGVKKIIEVDYFQTYGRKERPLGNGYDQLRIKPEVHAKESCHAGVVDGEGRVTLVCTRPERHPEAKSNSGKGPLTDAEKAKRAAKRAHNKERREAEALRTKTMGELLQKRIPKAALLEHLVTQWIHTAPYSSRKLACELLGLAGIEPKGQYGSTDYMTPLLEFAAQGTTQLDRAVLALSFGSAELPLRQDWPQWTSLEARRHFAFLEAQGYQVSPAERLELDGKAPR
jgi:ParB family chromosome partitioning protein